MHRSDRRFTLSQLFLIVSSSAVIAMLVGRGIGFVIVAALLAPSGLLAMWVARVYRLSTLKAFAIGGVIGACYGVLLVFAINHVICISGIADAFMLVGILCALASAVAASLRVRIRL